MNPNCPEHFKLVYSKEQIAGEISRLGREVSLWAKVVRESTGQDIIGVPVLRGGIFFFADLVRYISESVEASPVRTWGYLPGQDGVQSETVKIGFDGLNVEDRAVLLIDDLCDSGRTLAVLEKELLSHGASEVRSVVLINRLLSEPSYIPDYIGFEYKGDDWFVGYGMDSKERWRNLPDVYITQAK